ncbi:capZ-interacting protein-like isoform X2 [Acipenser ruthenus]|uniref:capZ-interacting protein-like isoform X2 n=1 Tax=Acipenser ruthenus TaxID=7906 RepID=UPI002741F901|nr:capZ-interacting protein-like isoform X2 [Acipenser ruthenus]
MEDQSISTAKATEDKPVKKSVAELAGKFKGQAIPSPAGKDVNNRVNRRRPPSSLALHDTKKESGQSEEEKGATNASSLSLKVKTKNSPLIEKLQANLALSPNALLPSPKSPGLKLHPSSFPFASPSSTPSSPGVRSHSSEEASASFDKPAEGTVLHNINKGRARLSIKRRPPSRKLRKSSSEEPTGKTPSPSQEQPRQNGEDDVFEAVKVEDPKEDNKPSMKEPEGSVKSSEGDKLQDGPKSKTLGESVEHMGKVSQEKPDRPQETPEACESVEAEHRPSKKAQAETRALDNTPGDIQTAGLSSNNEDTKTGETSKEEEEVKANQEEVKTNQEEEVKTNQEEEVKTNQEEEVKTNQEEEVKTNQEEEVKTNGSDDKDKQPEGDGN